MNIGGDILVNLLGLLTVKKVGVTDSYILQEAQHDLQEKKVCQY